MSNITPLLNNTLKSRNTHCALHPRTRASTRDEFLKEAYRIAAHISSLNAYLLSIRTPYLSTAPPPPRHHSKTTSHQSTAPHFTTHDRDAIDADAKRLLRDLSASLRQLSDAESVRQQTVKTVREAKHKKGFLGSWAAGGDGGAGGKSEEEVREEGKDEVLGRVRESVLWFLGRRLEGLAGLQRELMERRVRREVEKGRSVLYLVKGDGAGKQGMGGSLEEEQAGRGKAKAAVEKDEEESRRVIEQQLSPEQLQLFAQENQDMLRRYEDTLDQVRTAERSMLEISELQTTLVQNLDIQSANISQLVADSLSTTENVGGGNKELKRASERKSTARMVFWASCGLCTVLVGWDLIF